jgi:N-formylglutamate deformylase
LKGKKQLPILIVIPHGGCNVPEELFGYEALSKFDLFMQSDACANDLFSFGDRVAATIDTDISRLFMDLDRPYTSLRPDQDGVIKKSTRFGAPVFKDGHFPDEIALANLIQRYWVPFHEAVKKIIGTGSVRLILDCHTMMAVGPKMSRDPGKPRPLVMIEHQVQEKDLVRETCTPGMAKVLMDQMEKSFSDEEYTIAEKFVINDTPAGGYIMKHFAGENIPILRVSLSQSLFLNDTHFSYDYIRVDELRIRRLKSLLWSAIERFARKCL